MAGKSVPKVKQKLDKKDLTLSLAFLLPAILITVIFVIYPVFDTVGLSFRKWNGMFGAAKQWVGLENYQKIFSDKLFWNAMLNSVYFMIGGFVILMPLSFGLAMLVTAKIKGTGFFRTCYFLPNMLGTTAVALMWTFMLNPNFGIFNTIENIFGLHGTIPDVLTIKTVNVWIVILVNEWMYAGYNMLIFAAGLVAIPDELNEAAALDGATGWQRVRYITLPLILSITNDLAYNMYIYVFRFLIRARLDFLYYFKEIMVPEIIFTTVTTLLVYRLLLFINRKLEERMQRRDSTIV